jgi:hypothetical protein
LAQFDALRQRLARDLGLRPSPVLGRLYEAMLAGDRGLDAAGAGTEGDQPVTVRSARAERTRLSRDVADFTGRVHGKAALFDAFSGAGRGRAAVISGPVGVGRTTPAAQCAHRLGDRFPGGRAAAGLRTPGGGPRPLADVFAELLRGVGFTGVLPRGVEARAALPRQSAAGRAMLFVLDDAVSEAPVGAVLALVGDAGLMVTSRRPLGGVEAAAHVCLAPMGATRIPRTAEGDHRPPAGGGRARGRATAGGALLRAAVGAVRVVGAKLAGLRHLTLARYAARLADEDRLLDELAVGDLRLRSRLASAYRDLEPDSWSTAPPTSKRADCGTHGRA